MNATPIVGRTELWHPLFVHFPIALLTLSTIIGILTISLWNKRFAPHLRFSTSLLLWCGVLFFWIAFYTGNLAYSVEVRRICDPTVLKDHLLWAYISGIIFSIATVADIAQKILSRFVSKWPYITIVFVMLLGAIALAYDGHLGASLVYEQGAGVRMPSSDCSEYD